jgi:hypothetical protein
LFASADLEADLPPITGGTVDAEGFRSPIGRAPQKKRSTTAPVKAPSPKKIRLHQVIVEKVSWVQ